MIQKIKIISLVLLLVSCGKTKDEEDIVKMFFGNVGEETNYSHYDEGKTVFYDAIFSDNSEFKPFSTFNDNKYGIGMYDEGYYIVQSKEGHYHSVYEQLTNYDSNRNFQAELRFSWNAVENTKVSFFIHGRANDMANTVSVQVSKVENDNYAYLLKNHDTRIGTVKLNTDIRSSLLTIRRVNDKFYFFVNKQHIYTMPYVATNKVGMGYEVTNNTNVNISKLIFEYLD